MTSPSHRGFTLVETLIATGVLVTAIAGLAQLFAWSVRFTRDSGQFGAALVTAQDKLESLRSLAFTYDAAGNAIIDPRLHESPATSLGENTDRYHDWIDESGRVVAAAAATRVRRWRITDIAADDPAAVAIEVCVFDAPSRDREPIDADACVSTIRVRQP